MVHHGSPSGTIVPRRRGFVVAAQVADAIVAGAFVVDAFAVAALVVALGTGASFAQTPPQAGPLLRETERTAPKPAAPAAPPLVVPGDTRTLQIQKAPAEKIAVRDFRITGATLIPAEELREEVRSFIGSELTLSELRRAALRISDAYRRKGLFARALIPEQRIQGGVVEISVVEGRLSAVEIEALPEVRFPAERARRTIVARQPLGEPLVPEALQGALRNLNDVPGVVATGVLQPGAAGGDVKLNLRLDATPLLNASAYLDNYGLRSTGQARAIGFAQLNSPAGYGDQATVLGVATSRSDYLRAGYSLPIGYGGLRAGVNAAQLKYSLSGNFSGFGGSADIFGASLAQPLRRDAASNVFGGLAYENKQFVNNAAGGVNLNDKRTETFGVSVYGDYLDTAFGEASNAFNVGLVSGRLDLSRNAGDLAADALGARTNGGYTKLAWLYNRLQKATERSVFAVVFSGQVAGKNLDSSEKISLGGPTGVRAYPTGEALGDQGWIANLEWRYALREALQASVFFDAAEVHVFKSPFPGANAANPARPNRYGLLGAGIGLAYSRPNEFIVRGSVAGKLGNNPGRDASGNDVDGGRGRTRGWIQLIKFF